MPNIGPNNQYGFSPDDVLAIKRLVEIAIKQNTPIDQMFPGNSPLAQEGALLYLEMKGASFVFGARPQPEDPRDIKVGQVFNLSIMPPDHAIVDWRSVCSPIENQGEINSCTANAMVGAMEVLEKRQRLYTDKSRLFEYYNTRFLENDVDKDSGATIRETVKAAAKWGICTENIWPYDARILYERPSDACYTDAINYRISNYISLDQRNVDQALSVVYQGYPVVFAMYVYPEFMDTEMMKFGYLQMPHPHSTALGAHAVVLVGFDIDQKQFIVRNSWGPAFGISGYFYMPFDYYSTYTFDPWTIIKTA